MNMKSLLKRKQQAAGPSLLTFIFSFFFLNFSTGTTKLMDFSPNNSFHALPMKLVNHTSSLTYLSLLLSLFLPPKKKFARAFVFVYFQPQDLFGKRFLCNAMTNIVRE